jgi:hypothetical protein
MATSCLMCGASLEEEEAGAEAPDADVMGEIVDGLMDVPWAAPTDS